LLVIGVSAGCGSQGDAADAPSSSSAAQANPAKGPKQPTISILDSEQFKAAAPEMQDTIRYLRVDDTETFALKSPEQKLLYGSLLLDIYQDWAVFQAKENNYAHESLAVDNIPVITETSRGQEIVDNSSIVRCTQWYSLTVASGGGPGKLARDRSDAVKMEALRVSPLTDIYDRDTKDINSSPEFTSNLLCSGDIVVTQESPAITGRDGSITKTVQGEWFTHEVFQETYRYVEYVDYLNKKRSTWMLMGGAAKASPDWINDLSALH
jgi:hypothetical protein